MKLYHGRGEKGARGILWGSFQNSPDDGMSTRGGDIEGVWVAEELYHAAQYGHYVIEIELPDDALDHAKAIWEDEGPYGETEIIFDAEWLNKNWLHLNATTPATTMMGCPGGATRNWLRS